MASRSQLRAKLYLRAGIEKQAADGSKYNPDCEKQRQHRLWRQDGSVRLGGQQWVSCA